MKSTGKSRKIAICAGLLIISLLSVENSFAQRYSHRRDRHVVVRHIPPHYARGYRFSHIPRGYVNVNFGGFSYRYGDGVFVRPHGAAFVVAPPPIGIRVNFLPPVYTRVYVNRRPYFYYNGIYYNQVNRDEYEVVNPPVGARISTLPENSSSVVINGQKYFVFDDTYYREIISQDNEIWYEVVSRDEVNTNPLAQNGARFPALPYDAKTVVLAGQKYFIADGIYYQEIIENGRIMYEIVGKE